MDSETNVTMAANINDACEICFRQAATRGWWEHEIDANEIDAIKNKIVRMALVTTEISEAVEGIRKVTMDEHLPHRPSEEVELADAVIRIFDYCGGHGIDLGGAIVEKLDYNSKRQDHDMKTRAKEGGKKV